MTNSEAGVDDGRRRDVTSRVRITGLSRSDSQINISICAGESVSAPRTPDEPGDLGVNPRVWPVMTGADGAASTRQGTDEAHVAIQTQPIVTARNRVTRRLKGDALKEANYHDTHQQLRDQRRGEREVWTTSCSRAGGINVRPHREWQLSPPAGALGRLRPDEKRMHDTPETTARFERATIGDELQRATGTATVEEESRKSCLHTSEENAGTTETAGRGRDWTSQAPAAGGSEAFITTTHRYHIVTIPSIHPIGRREDGTSLVPFLSSGGVAA